MSVNGAPKELQPWIIQTDSRLQAAQDNLNSANNTLTQFSMPDKTVFTSPTVMDFLTSGSAAQTVYPANNSVKYNNTSGLMQVTVTCTLLNFNGGRSGVGFFYDNLAPTIINGVPQYGMGDVGVSSTVSTLYASSYTFVLPVRPGSYTCGLYYYSDNTAVPASSTSQVTYAQLIVGSV